MSLLEGYREARQREEFARLSRVLALRALVATGVSQRDIARALGVSQPAISQQLRFAPDIDQVRSDDLLQAAAPVLKTIAGEHGYRRLAAFGSVARGEARATSDIDLIVESPEGASSFDFIRFKQLLERVLGREIDLADYAGLSPTLDEDIRRELVPL